MFSVSEEILEALKRSGIDVVVGIPSFNNASTIRYVAETAAEGILKFFDGKGVIINSDGGSTDGTKEAFMSSDTKEIQKISFVYRGVPGKGSAMRAVFELASRVDAKAIVFLDSDLRSVQPWWVERLAKPIVMDLADYVSPYYIRHKYDATITNHICYPMTAMLYGKKIRQPIGGDFGVGKKAYELYLVAPDNVWESNVARFGIDIWMTTMAVANGLRVMQAALGAKVHDVKDPGKHLGPMFRQVVSTLFALMVDFEHVWKDVKGVEEVEIYGDMPEVELEEIVVDLENLVAKAKDGVKQYRTKLESFIKKELLDEVEESGILNVDEWIEIVFHFAKKFKRTRDEEIVDMMVPMYFARVAGFVKSTQDLTTDEAEKVVEEQLSEFVSKKDYLMSIWF